MAKIYKLTDRIKIKIADVTVTVRPLSAEQKHEIQALMYDGTKQKDLALMTRGLITAMKHALCDIDGVECSDGQPYKLEIVDNLVTDSCIDDLLNLEIHTQLSQVCSALANGIPKEFKIEGVSFAEVASEKKT